MPSNKNLIFRLIAKDLASAQIKGVNSALVKTGQTSQQVNTKTAKLAAGFGAMAGQVGLVTVALSGMYAGFQQMMAGLRFVEDFKLSIAGLAGFMTTFSEKAQQGDMAGAFRDSYKYASALVPKLELLDAKTIATGHDLQLIMETMATYGTVLDINNKRQEKGFLNIVNALKLITKGQNQEIQMRQEIHALMMGQMRMTDRLPKLLLRIDPLIKDHLAIWKQQGTVIENVGALLNGFEETVKEFEQTWAAVGTTMQTIYRRTLREGFLTAYDDLIKYAKAFNKANMDSEGQLQGMSKMVIVGIRKIWISIKNLYDVFLPFKPLFEQLTALALMSADGWGKLLAFMAPIGRRTADFVGALIQSTNALGEAFLSLWDALSFDKAGAKLHWKEAQKAFFESGKLTGVAFREGLWAEIDASLAEYEKASGINKITIDGIMPKLTPPPGETEKAGKELAKNISEPWKQAMRDMQSATKNLFVDVLKGDFDNLGSKFVDMLDNMVANWIAAQLQMKLWGAAAGGSGEGWIMQGLGLAASFFGGNSAAPVATAEGADLAYAGYGTTWSHSGGVVGSPGWGDRREIMPASMFAHAPRLHNGLAPDEFPAILQRGERVIPKNQAPMAPTVNIYNRGKEKTAQVDTSFDKMRGWVIDVFLEDYTTGGPTRQILSGGVV